MALHHLDLGQIDLVSTTSDRHLRLTSSVQLTASEEALRSLHVVDSREGCSSRRTWMTPAAGFHLTIDLHLCSDLLICRHDLADALAQTLFDASFWRQLQLEPKAKVVSAGSSDSCMRLQICLDYAAGESPASVRSVHRLAQDVPYHDIEPPPGIQTARLHHVSLHMRFSDTSDRKRRRTPASWSLVNGSDDDDMLELSDAGPTLSPVFEPWTCPRIRRTRITPGRATSPPSQRPMLAPHGELTDGGEEHCPPTLKRCYNTSATDYHPQNHHHEDIFALCDAGIRYAIATPRKRSLKDVELVGHESLTQLSSICPAVFSPSHWESLSSRTILLPTVSHALTQTCGVHARNAALQSKLLELSRRIGASSYPGVVSSATQEHVAVHLWRSTQAGLFDSDAASRLQPLASRKSGHVDMLHEAGSFKPSELRGREVGDCDEAGLDNRDGDCDDEDLFESHGSHERDFVFTKRTPESSQEDFLEMFLGSLGCDTDGMLSARCS